MHPNRGTVHSSYWDSDTSDISSGYGTAQTSSDLRMPTDYTGIYTAWAGGLSISGDNAVENITIYCDRDNDGSIGADERDDANRIWDFGAADDYPVVRCIPTAPAEWRRWWFLNGAGQPELNQTRLDDLVP